MQIAQTKAVLDLATCRRTLIMSMQAWARGAFSDLGSSFFSSDVPFLPCEPMIQRNTLLEFKLRFIIITIELMDIPTNPRERGIYIHRMYTRHKSMPMPKPTFS
jgi:hypothetical protein